jgi:hypothetical protein
MKDAFQGYFFNTHQNDADHLNKGVLVCELTFRQELFSMAKEAEIRGH